MANFDEQLSRMHYLMGYKMPVVESKSGVEHSVVAADGKRYGIIKEGTKFYVKVSDAAKENIAESYDYINGVLAKKENEHKSYNSASKALELKLMSLNEAYNGNVKASLFDSKSNEKMFANLTEEARKELNRMHQIFESANTIGKNNTGNPEAPKTASFSEKIGKPFDITAKAELDKDFKKTANNPESQSEPFDAEVKVTDADMESDKMPSGEKNNCEEYEDAKYVPDGSVANQKPTGGKVVKVNESTDLEGEGVITEDDEIVGIEDENEGGENILSDEELDSMFNDEGNIENEEMPTLDADELGFNDPVESDPRFAGMNVSDEEFMNSIDGEVYDDKGSEFAMESKASLKRIVEGVCDAMMKERLNEIGDTLKGQHKLGRLARRKDLDNDPKGSNDVAIYAYDRTQEKYPSFDRDGEKTSAKSILGQALNRTAYDYGYHGDNFLELAKSTYGMKTKMDEIPTVKESFNDKLVRIIKEEITNLNVWGQHPGYKKQPMSIPDNKEVIVNNGDKDWNHDSVKGSEPFGKKIGSSAPFTDDVVKKITDVVLTTVKATLKKK